MSTPTKIPVIQPRSGRLPALAAGLIAVLVISDLAMAKDFLAGLPDPTRPYAPGQRIEIAPQGGMILQSTTVSRDSRTAVINGKSLSEGDRIEGARLVAINPHEVTLTQAGREISLRLMPLLAKPRTNTEAYYAVKP